jgi:hypothetical protein
MSLIMHHDVIKATCWNEICGHHNLKAKNHSIKVQNFSVWVFQNSELLLGIIVS